MRLKRTSSKIFHHGGQFKNSWTDWCATNLRAWLAWMKDFKQPDLRQEIKNRIFIL